MDYEELCLSVCEIARNTGRFIAGERTHFDLKKVENKGLHDLVSYVDKAAEKQIVEALALLLPESGFIAEEGTSTKKGDRFNWVIDPLDGTTNFVQGVPVYSVSIGLLEGEELVLGVVYEIGRDECFYAWKGGKSYLNGQEIHVSNTSEMHNALLATGFPYNNFSKIDSYLKLLRWAMTDSRGVRRLGSAAVDLAYVACGRFDIFFEYNLNPWDVAAGAFIVQQAGGRLSDFKRGENYLFGREIVASNPYLIHEMQEKVATFIL